MANTTNVATATDTLVIDQKNIRYGGPSIYYGKVKLGTPMAPNVMRELHISGFPDSTRGISVWLTEDTGSGNSPHAGSAMLKVYSVQLYHGGTHCRVIYEMINHAGEIGVGAQIIFG